MKCLNCNKKLNKYFVSREKEMDNPEYRFYELECKNCGSIICIELTMKFCTTNYK